MLAASKALTEVTNQLKEAAAAHGVAQTAAKSHASEVERNTAALKEHALASSAVAKGMNGIGSAVGASVVFFQIMYDAAKKLFEVFTSTFGGAINNIDDFRKGTIGAAASMTNLASESGNAGKTWEEIFNRNLKATTQTFFELEKLSAKYFASSIDLQQAYNAFAQRGIIIRRAEFSQLAQLVDMILLLTKGQQTSIQVQEEIRSLVNGSIRPTAQLSQLIKAFGLDVKEVADQIRATQSLAPLEAILRGSAASTKAIQNTYSAAANGLETIIRQTSRFGFETLYDQLVQSVQKATAFLQQHQANIVGIFAVISNAVGNAIDQVGKLGSGFIKGGLEGDTFAHGFIKFIAATESAVVEMALALNVVISALIEMPGLIDKVIEKMDLLGQPAKVRSLIKDRDKIQAEVDFAEKQVEDRGGFGAIPKDISQKLKLDLDNAKAAIREINQNIFANEHPFLVIMNSVKAGLNALKEGLGGLPWSDTAKEYGKLIDENTSKTQAAIKKLAEYNPFNLYDQRTKELNAALAKGKASVAPGETTTEAPINNPFKESPAEEQELIKLQNESIAARDRYNRALRTSDELASKADTTVHLHELQRQLTLVAQGFTIVGDHITGFRSSLTAAVDFVGKHIESFVTGQAADFKELFTSVEEIQQDIISSVFTNLKAQFDGLTTGLEEFKKIAEAASDRLRVTEVAVPKQQAADIRTEAASRSDVIIAGAEKALDAEIERYEAAEATKDQHKIDGAYQELIAEKIRYEGALKYAADLVASREIRARLLDEVAAANEGKIVAQQTQAVAAFGKRVSDEQLRVTQQVNQEVAKMLQTNLQINDVVQKRLILEQGKAPRTTLQADEADISSTKLQFAVQAGQAQANLDILTNRLTALGLAAQQADINAYDLASKQVVSIRELQDETIKQMEINKNFKTSWAAIGNAVETSLHGMAKALTDSFEGKQTDYKALFKGVADQLFQDSLKNLFESAKVALQKGFKNMLTNLDIEGDMASTLGPAFLAGFALIASFVLGQLIGGSHNSATAANPQVGISSSEQVRGLIGGATQIPIGQIGASLQDALVPTNILLTRIAQGVERAGVGGVSTSAIESAIATAVSDSIQIQMATH